MTRKPPPIKSRKRLISSLLLLLILLPLLNTSVAQETNLVKEDQAFTLWLDNLRQEALDKGISLPTITSAFSEITPPVKRIIQNDRNQAEVIQTYSHYLNARVSRWKKDKGRQLFAEHYTLLSNIAHDFGVQPRFILAIWGMETNYGTFPIKEPIFNALATLAYDNRRAAFFRAQFLAALKILDSGFPTYDKMTSSWAGAMGQPQFIPESYLQLAVDYDGDGKRDIWDTKADVFASIANYFKSRGWQADQTWGRPVLLPENGEKTLAGIQAEGLTPDKYCKRFRSIGVWRDLQTWQKLGVRRADGSDLPTRSIPAALIMADSGDNKGYIVYRNFCTIMSFNPAFKYALSIGLLSDTLEYRQ